MVVVIVKKIKPYQTSLEIQRLYKWDEFKTIIPYGPLGCGKSTYAIKVLAEVLGSPGEPDYESVKDYIVFHPRDFIDRCMHHEGREPAIIWDDAGLWLHALDFNDPFVKAVGKYISVARTDWAAIIFTTPLPTWIFSKVREVPDAITIKIKKTIEGNKKKYRYRQAVAYRFWKAPDLKHSGVKSLWIDEFKGMLPDSFFKWYKPLRDRYATLAKHTMDTELKRIIDKNPEYNVSFQ